MGNTEYLIGGRKWLQPSKRHSRSMLTSTQLRQVLSRLESLIDYTSCTPIDPTNDESRHEYERKALSSIDAMTKQLDDIRSEIIDGKRHG